MWCDVYEWILIQLWRNRFTNIESVFPPLPHIISQLSNNNNNGSTWRACDMYSRPIQLQKLALLKTRSGYLTTELNNIKITLRRDFTSTYELNRRLLWGVTQALKSQILILYSPLGQEIPLQLESSHVWILDAKNIEPVELRVFGIENCYGIRYFFRAMSSLTLENPSKYLMIWSFLPIHADSHGIPSTRRALQVQNYQFSF